MLVTGTSASVENKRECAVVASATSTALPACSGSFHAPSSNSSGSRSCRDDELSSSTIIGSALVVTSGSAAVRALRAGERSPRASASAISIGRRGNSDDSLEDGSSNWQKSTCVTELAAFDTAVGGSAISALEMEAAAALVFEAARVIGYVATGPLVDACFVTDTASGLTSSARRLQGFDLRLLGDLFAGATVVEETPDATLVWGADRGHKRSTRARLFRLFSGRTSTLRLLSLRRNWRGHAYVVAAAMRVQRRVMRMVLGTTQRDGVDGRSRRWSAARSSTSRWGRSFSLV